MGGGASGVNAYFQSQKLHGSVGQLLVRMGHLALLSPSGKDGRVSASEGKGVGEGEGEREGEGLLLAT